MICPSLYVPQFLILSLAHCLYSQAIKKVHVGDIDVVYKIFGESNNTIILINGAGEKMNFWDPHFLKDSVIVFDSRGIGNTALQVFLQHTLTDEKVGVGVDMIPFPGYTGYGVCGLMTTIVLTTLSNGSQSHLSIRT